MIKDNQLPASLVRNIQTIITSNDFPWYWIPHSVDYDRAQKDPTFQFGHELVSMDVVKSQAFEHIRPLLYFFEQLSGYEIVSIRRIKANLLPEQTYSADDLKLSLHRDVGPSDITDVTGLEDYSNYVTLIYYPDDSDGNTILYDNDLNEIEQISPVKGRLAWFPATMIHRATPPTDNKRRIVLNCILQVV